MPDHREAERALREAGWTMCGAGDWAIALRSPDGTMAARISPFDPTGPYTAALYRQAAHTRQVPVLFEHVRLAGGGDLQVMEWLRAVPEDEAVAFHEAIASCAPQVADLVAVVRQIHDRARRELPWCGPLDHNPADVMRAADGRLVVADLFYADGPDLYATAATDPDLLVARIPESQRRFMTEIPLACSGPWKPGEQETMRAGLAAADARKQKPADAREQELLWRLARREVEDDDPEAPVPHLVALHQRPLREVFDRAAALASAADPVERTLGVRILRELGEAQPDGRRPFSTETIPLLRARLAVEADPGVLRWIVSALGYHRAGEALPDVVPLAGHPDARVRFHVAAALPGLVDPRAVQPDAADALLRLCEDEDEDADIRYYALYAAVHEIAGLSADRMTALTARLMHDPDDQIRAMAAEHHAALHKARTLRSGKL